MHVPAVLLRAVERGEKRLFKNYVYASSNYINITCKENITLDLPWALAEPAKDKKAVRKMQKQA